MAEYELHVSHRAAVRKQGADGVLRLKTPSYDISPFDNEVSAFFLFVQALARILSTKELEQKAIQLLKSLFTPFIQKCVHQSRH